MRRTRLQRLRRSTRLLCFELDRATLCSRGDTWARVAISGTTPHARAQQTESPPALRQDCDRDCESGPENQLHRDAQTRATRRRQTCGQLPKPGLGEVGVVVPLEDLKSDGCERVASLRRREKKTCLGSSRPGHGKIDLTVARHYIK